MTDLLSFERVCFAYNGRPVLDRLTLGIRRGEMVGVCGPNGSGKTTLLRLGGGLLEPREGAVRLDGAPVGRLPARELARRLAFVPQETHLLFPFRAREVVLMGRAPWLGTFGFERDEDIRVATEAMDQADVLPFADRSVHRLSGGEKQRVLLARALAQEPEILLLDEPTHSLDLKHALGLFRSLEAIHRKRDLTVLVVSHDLNLLAQHCRRIVLMRDGRILADGAPAEVITTDLIRDVFDVEARVERAPDGGAPVVVPRSMNPAR